MATKKNEQKKQKRLSNDKLLRLSFVLLLVALIGVASGLYLYATLMVSDSLVVPYDFRVNQNMIGIDADTDDFGFGTIPRGGFSTRGFTITADEDVTVLIVAGGTGAEWIRTSKNGLYLKKGETGQFSLTVFVPENAEEGSYAGAIRMVLTRPGVHILGLTEQQMKVVAE